MPIIILCIIYYEYGGELQEKRLIKYIKRSYSQLSSNLRKLEGKKYILREKNRGRVKIQITQSGVNFISKYSKNAVKILITFFDFYSKLNRMDKKVEIGLIQTVLRDYLNDSDVITILDHLNEKYGKMRKILQKKEYYKTIYAECEQGSVRDTLIHQVFVFLHQNQDVSKQTLYIRFPKANRGTLSTLYRKWENLTYEKYVLPYL